MASVSHTSLYWLDCEMTGLDPASHRLLEMAFYRSDLRGERVSVGPHYVLHIEETWWDRMDAWCQKTHRANGLWEAARASDWSVEEVEMRLCTWVLSHGDQMRHLAGNSIWCDRAFLRAHMPKLDQLFHYRMLDVSSLKLTYAFLGGEPPKKSEHLHRVQADIQASIQEYGFYLKEWAHV